MSTHIFPLAGPIDPECVICRKPRSQIEREDADEALIAERRAAEQNAMGARVTSMVNTIKVQLRTAGIALVNESKLSSGYGDYALVLGTDADRIIESIARNILQVLVLELP